MNLESLYTQTTVSFDDSAGQDTLTINANPASPNAINRVSAFLDIFRNMVGKKVYANILSDNNFPLSAGMASSSSAFAALSLAASRALGLDLSEFELSRLARRGSGSACRSIPSGFVEWEMGSGDEDSYAHSIATPQHWKLTDCIAVVQSSEKAISSQAGHIIAPTSPIQMARNQDAPRRLDICRQAILKRDFNALAQIIELDSNLMHAVMMTSSPSLIYWQPSTLAIMKIVMDMRSLGWPACYTIDAGANVHIICEADYSPKIANAIKQIPTVKDVILSSPGEGAILIPFENINNQ